jgi:hypothetical protein
MNEFWSYINSPRRNSEPSVNPPLVVFFFKKKLYTKKLEINFYFHYKNIPLSSKEKVHNKHIEKLKYPLVYIIM